MLGTPSVSFSNAVYSAESEVTENKIHSLKNSFYRMLLAEEIANNIAQNIGAAAKARIAFEVMRKEGTLYARSTEMSHLLLNAQYPLSPLSNTQITTFAMNMQQPIKDALSRSFSDPKQFIESERGIEFHLSNFSPREFVQEQARLAGFRLGKQEIPESYQVELKLDKKLSQENSDLVFTCTHKSENVVFSKETYSISELLKKHYQTRSTSKL